MALLTLEGLPSKSSLILRDNKQLILEIENSRLHPSPIHSSIWFLHSGALFPSPNHPQGLPRGINGKESACNVGGVGLISGSGRSPAEGHGNTLQYSCLQNPMDRGAWWATVRGVTLSRTRQKQLNIYTRITESL